MSDEGDSREAVSAAATVPTATVPTATVPTATVVTANVNGIRAAARRGGLDWLARTQADVVCLQEVRANDEQLGKALADAGLGHLNVVHAPASAAGRSGVAVLTPHPVDEVAVGVGPDEFADSGRWIEATVRTTAGPLRVVSVYVHTGEADTPRQDEKHRFLEAMRTRMAELAATAANGGAAAIVCGDLNVARTEADIKNWRGNRGKAGFLESERQFLDDFAAHGWVDVGRELAGDVAGPYTWWSWRGQAFDNDAGWRIDYVWATPEFASLATACDVHRAASYAERWSDHAAVSARFG